MPVQQWGLLVHCYVASNCLRVALCVLGHNGVMSFLGGKLHSCEADKRSTRGNLEAGMKLLLGFCSKQLSGFQYKGHLSLRLWCVS